MKTWYNFNPAYWYTYLLKIKVFSYMTTMSLSHTVILPGHLISNLWLNLLNCLKIPFWSWFVLDRIQIRSIHCFGCLYLFILFSNWRSHYFLWMSGLITETGAFVLWNVLHSGLVCFFLSDVICFLLLDSVFPVYASYL